MKWNRSMFLSCTAGSVALLLVTFFTGCGSEGCRDQERYDSCIDSIESLLEDCEAEETQSQDACYWRGSDYQDRFSICSRHCEWGYEE